MFIYCRLYTSGRPAQRWSSLHKYLIRLMLEVGHQRQRIKIYFCVQVREGDEVRRPVHVQPVPPAQHASGPRSDG